MKTPRARASRLSDSPARISATFFGAKLVGLVTLIGATLTPHLTETAIANGDTRTIYLHHSHTNEDIAATYLVGGQYDSNVLRQLNWFLRDWRRDEPTNMDPRLFDVVWEAYRHAGAGNQVVTVVSAYRSPETNAMLRSRSRAVAKYSQHMLGKAMDTTMPGMPMSHIREIGMRMQRGGVGYYPTAHTPFVHLDVGNVRSWPRMSYDQLVRLFPDGKTVHLPTNGQPLARYEEARAEIEARGNGAYVTAPRRTVGGFFAMLFGGGGGGEDEEEVAAPPPSTRKQWASLAPRRGRGAQYAEGGEEEGAAPAEPPSRRGRAAIARAEADLPRGETAMSAAGADAANSASEAAPEQQAAPAPQKLARAPLPPHRPASLIAKIEPEPEAPVAAVADAGKPTPIENQTTEHVAAAEPAQELRSALPENEPAKATARIYANLPLPPRRPMMLVAAISDAPLPPLRPGDAASQRAIATLMDPSELKASPEGRAAEEKASDENPLAYARPETPVPPRRAAMAPARLDRSNFRTLTATTPTSHASGGTVLGSSIAGVRAAARATANGVLAPAGGTHAAGFAPAHDTPPADKFAPGR